MGCKACQGVEKNDQEAVNEIARCIVTENIKGLMLYLKMFIKKKAKKKIEIIDEIVIELNEFQLSFLAYALVAGSVKSFIVMIESFNASIPKMIEIFHNYSMSPLNVICEKNFLDLLKYFLPMFLMCRPRTRSMIDTLDLSNRGPKEPFDTFTPIQVACLHGSIAVIDYLTQYFTENPIALFNIRDINDETGESCALLAVRSGSLQCVQLLHKKYNMDFTVLNKFGETALQVCAVYSAKKGDPCFFEIFSYLIEEVKLDPTINHEEVLLVLKDGDIIKYYEGVLERFALFTKKSELDKANQVRQRETVKEIIRKEDEASLSIGKCTLGSTIGTGSRTSRFFDGSVYGSKAWFNQ